MQGSPSLINNVNYPQSLHNLRYKELSKLIKEGNWSSILERISAFRSTSISDIASCLGVNGRTLKSWLANKKAPSLDQQTLLLTLGGLYQSDIHVLLHKDNVFRSLSNLKRAKLDGGGGLDNYKSFFVDGINKHSFFSDLRDVDFSICPNHRGYKLVHRMPVKILLAHDTAPSSLLHLCSILHFRKKYASVFWCLRLPASLVLYGSTATLDSEPMAEVHADRLEAISQLERAFRIFNIVPKVKDKIKTDTESGVISKVDKERSPICVTGSGLQLKAHVGYKNRIQELCKAVSADMVFPSNPVHPVRALSPIAEDTIKRDSYIKAWMSSDISGVVNFLPTEYAEHFATWFREELKVMVDSMPKSGMSEHEKLACELKLMEAERKYHGSGNKN